LTDTPLIVGLGGTTAIASSSEQILRETLSRCEARGARTRLFGGQALDLPTYSPSSSRTEQARALIAALREADGVIIVSPGYHGTISGMLKNALDYVQDMAGDERPYFDGRAVGLVAVAAGWQATGSTLATLRTIAHALRGWPTPLGVAINAVQADFDEDRRPIDPANLAQLDMLAGQVVGFARLQLLGRGIASPAHP
jgi:FMN reductase